MRENLKAKVLYSDDNVPMIGNYNIGYVYEKKSKHMIKFNDKHLKELDGDAFVIYENGNVLLVEGKVVLDLNKK